MLLGGPVHTAHDDPDAWVAELRRLGYGAAYCPVGTDADDATVRAFEAAAAGAGIVIAEVGAWSNPLSPDEAIRDAALAKCQECLALADRIGARCCVNIAGSRGPSWHGPHPDDLTDEGFDLIVETVRRIIDAVAPSRTFYTLETMPWMYPDSADSYVRLLRAIDRPRFAVHLDPTNLVNSPRRYFETGAIIAECFAKLGPRVRSCHAKDITLSTTLMVHLDEVRPGLGNLDYRVFLAELNKLPADTPLMLEHLATEEEYVLAAGHIRTVALEIGASFA